MTDTTDKRKRAPNYTTSEVDLFSDVLLPKYKNDIENKETDAQTRKEKAAAWTKLTDEFNRISSFYHRTEDSLKNL